MPFATRFATTVALVSGLLAHAAPARAQDAHWTFGGATDDQLDAIAPAPDGSAVYVCGSMSAARPLLDPASGQLGSVAAPARHVFVARLEGTRVAWLHVARANFCTALALHPGGVLVAAGGYQGDADFDPLHGGDARAGQLDPAAMSGFVMRLSTAGQYQGTVVSGSGGAFYPAAMAVAPDGDLVELGSVTGAPARFAYASPRQCALVVRERLSGEVEWVAPLCASGHVDPRAVLALGDGSVVLGGDFSGELRDGARAFRPAGVRHPGFVARVAAGAVVDWVRVFERGDALPEALAAAPDGSIWIGGTFQRAVDLDPGPAAQVRTAIGSPDGGFVAHFSVAGRYQWGGAFDGGPGTEVRALATGRDGGVVVALRADGVVDVDPGPATDLRRPERGDVTLVRLGSTGSYLGAAQLAGTVPGHARPACGALYVRDLALGADASGNARAWIAGEYTHDFDLGGAAQHTAGGRDGVLASIDLAALRVERGALAPWVLDPSLPSWDPFVTRAYPRF